MQIKCWRFILWITMLLAAALGCEKSRNPGTYVNDKPPLFIKDMSPNDVIVVINGIKLTKGDYTDLQKLDEVFFRLKKGHNLRSSYEDVEHHLYVTEQCIFDSLVKGELLRQAFEKYGIAVSEEEVEAEWEKLAGRLSRPGKKLVEVQNEVGARLGKGFYDIFADPLRTEKLLGLMVTNDYMTVSDQEMSNRVQSVAIFNENADRCNRENFEMLGKVREEILSGKYKFSDAAKKYSEVHPSEGKEWRDLALSEFPPQEDGTKHPVRAWLETANPGDISPPIEMDDGISIIGLVAKFDPPVPEGLEPYTDYRLVRVTRYYRERSIEQAPDEMREQLRTWKHAAAMQEMGAKLIDAAVIEFPHGTNFFPSAQESYEYWQEQFKNGR